MNIKPFGERVVVVIEEAKEKKVHGIIIPDSAKEKPQAGTVLAVGDGEEVSELIKDGDKVIFNKYSGNEFTIDGKDVIILDKDDVLAKLW
jgi:chaperonin GroES